MRKFILMLLSLALVSGVKALELTDQVTLTLLDHVTLSSQIGDGEKKAALLDSVVLIGSHNGRSVFDIQAGFSGDARPEVGQAGLNWIASGFLKVSSLVRDRVKFADHWKFLNALEYGVSYSYDFTQKRDYAAIQLGLAFGVEPK